MNFIIRMIISLLVLFIIPLTNTYAENAESSPREPIGRTDRFAITMNIVFPLGAKLAAVI